MSTLAHRARSVRTLLIAAASLAVLIIFGAAQADAAYRFTGVTADPSSLQAGGHPAAHFALDPDAANADNTGGDDLKRVVFDYAAGQVINPRVITTRCSSSQLSGDTCPAASAIGTVAASWRVAGLQKAVTGTVYVLSTTAAGSDASLGFVLRGSSLRKQSFTGQLTKGLVTRPTADAAFGPQLVIDPLPRTITSTVGLSLNATLDSLTIDIGPRAGGTSTGAFVSTNPTSCTLASGRVSGTSFKGVAVTATDTFTPTDCAAVPFAPTASATPPTTSTSTGLTLNVTLPSADQTPQQSQLKQATVTLPATSQIDFAGLATAVTCSAAQFAGDTCPALSKLGTVSLQTPLAASALTGNVYLLGLGVGASLGYVLHGPNGNVTGKATIAQVGSSAQLDLLDLPQLPIASLNLSLTTTAFKAPTTCSATATITLLARSGASASSTAPWPVIPCDPPPIVSIHSPPSGLRTNQPSVNVAFYVNGSSTIPSAVTCTVNGAPTTTPSTNSVVLNPGTNNIPVVCTSAGGQGSASVTVIRDVQPPTIGPISVSLISPTQARITYSAFDDSGQPPECIPPSGSIIPLQPGPNQITVNCRDQAGNVATSVVTIVVDPPQPFSVTITSGPTGTIFTPTATFTYQASEPLETTMQCPVGTVCPAVMVTRVTLQCILDGGAGTPCPINNALGGTYTTPQLLTGNHTFCVRGTRIADGAVAQDCRTFTVMNEPPPPPQCSVSGNTLTCTWTTPPGFVATCSLDGGPSASCVSPWVRPGLPPGVHNAQICLVGPSGSSCMSYPFTIAEVRPIVTITSPTNGSITTVSSVPLNFTVAGGVPPYICSRTSGTQVPLTIGSNTITVTCQGFDGSTGIASVTVTRQALTEFNPTYEQTYNSDPATLETGVTFSLNNPITSNPIKTAVVALPSAVQPNYPAFGSIQDRCAASAIVLTPAPVFSKSNCPAAARLGTVTLSSPAYSTPLHGDVYLVDRQPIPWLGVDFSDPSLGNPTNITWPQLVLRTSYPQVDPSCVPDETTLCPSVIKFDVSGLPDVQALQSTFAITGPDRSGSTGTLPGKLFRFETEVCDTINSTATLGSTANESVTRSSVISLPPNC